MSHNILGVSQAASTTAKATTARATKTAAKTTKTAAKATKTGGRPWVVIGVVAGVVLLLVGAVYVWADTEDGPVFGSDGQ